MEWKKFKSPNSMVRRVALLSGHIYEVGQEYVTLPEFAWSEAYSKGCISEEMLVGQNIPAVLLESLSNEAGEIEELELAIKEAIDVNAQDAFLKSGDPRTTYFSHKLGKQVNKELLYRAWFNVQNAM